MRTRLAKIAACAVATVALVGATVASAEVERDGNLFVSFSGSISPQKLPRDVAAPIGVQLGGKIKTTDRSEPPVLQRIYLDINREGRIQTKGLALCPLAKLNSLSAEGAKRACGAALVGRGSVTSRVTLPGQNPFASSGSLLAFNGKHKGGQAIFAQVSTGAPLRSTYVIVFEVKKKGGEFATSLVGTLPPIAAEYGYISAFNLSLRRTYSHGGKKLSYASASCPAPKGFTGASFPLAKVKYEFSDGRNLSSTLMRNCKVRSK